MLGLLLRAEPGHRGCFPTEGHTRPYSHPCGADRRSAIQTQEKLRRGEGAPAGPPRAQPPSSGRAEGTAGRSAVPPAAGNRRERGLSAEPRARPGRPRCERRTAGRRQNRRQNQARGHGAPRHRTAPHGPAGHKAQQRTASRAVAEGGVGQSAPRRTERTAARRSQSGRAAYAASGPGGGPRAPPGIGGGPGPPRSLRRAARDPACLEPAPARRPGPCMAHSGGPTAGGGPPGPGPCMAPHAAPPREEPRNVDGAGAAPPPPPRAPAPIGGNPGTCMAHTTARPRRGVTYTESRAPLHTMAAAPTFFPSEELD